MDVSTIQAEIQNEVVSIINILEKIQTELDELNTFTKPNGVFDTTIKEGLESTQVFFKMSGCSMNDKDVDVTELHTNIYNSTMKNSQYNPTDEATQINNDTTQ